MIEAIREAEKGNPKVKAIVCAVDSPEGVGPRQRIIWAEPNACLN